MARERIPSELKDTIAKNIKKHLEARDLSNAEFAKALDVSGVAVWRWTSGREAPSLPRLLEIAKFFETTVEELTT